jgi:hypothetical protein
MRLFGHHSRFAAANFLSGRVLAWIFIAMAICAGILAVPVIGDKFFGSFSVQAERAAKPLFCLGIGILLLGLFAGVPILVIVGGALAGAILLGIILVEY